MVREAFEKAKTERPGAVYLCVPEDVEAISGLTGLRPLSQSYEADSMPGSSQIAHAAHVLQAATKPIILAGHGAVRDHAGDALVRFSERLRSQSQLRLWARVFFLMIILTPWVPWGS
ncbi:hypothetical protein [Methanosarcina barkeri]|uniref:hypothetical protein n=1 Tax=Methanosarcina barkeri TaxID=2208 RepID=UPI00311FAED4